MPNIAAKDVETRAKKTTRDVVDVLTKAAPKRVRIDRSYFVVFAIQIFIERIVAPVDI